jgi:hypothetical protein
VAEYVEEALYAVDVPYKTWVSAARLVVQVIVAEFVLGVPEEIEEMTGAPLLHETETFVMFEEATVPEPFETVQVWPAGWVSTVTLYVPPVEVGVANVNEGLLDVTLRLSPPLF